jgi:hypothetical protein
VFISKNFDDSRREEVDACCILGRACQVSTLSLLALLVDSEAVDACCILGRACQVSTLSLLALLVDSEEVDACCILGRACQVSTLSLLALLVDKYKYGHLRRCVLGNGRHELGFKARLSNARLTSRLALTAS